MEASVQFLYHDLQGNQMQRSRQTDQNNKKNKMVRDQPGKTTTTTFSTPVGAQARE